jgi:hypothetical protein
MICIIKKEESLELRQRGQAPEAPVLLITGWSVDRQDR